ncbi:hypothetical protein POJ06DRAFT_242787 [Lipomyces tetrasporus]|uniref:FAD-binding FR-type domain-containing protein n=1 Tax=Lipomyces tetrasporus TaxID=54092 RepID=A0AAD7QYJ0_9ASCO|nr:uncharacterized protein POJ06DRAFT_242787 [Lipomyces tetrasporus]KAJ8103790.1 hypothetical protein POJ06DRAFT_242787 [Lipomyces tetrasporus]
MFSIDLTPSNEAKKFRRAVTHKYGNATLVVSFIVLVLIAVRAVSLGRLPKPLQHPFPLFLSVSLCAFVLALLSFLETHDDYLYLTKRLGRVAASAMPALYFLSLRPSPIPRESYLRLLPLHIWLARIIICLSTLHGILYIGYWAQVGNLAKIFEWANLLGVLVALGFFLTLVVSLRYFRRHNHELFFKTHYLFAWACVPILAYHARPQIWVIVFYLAVFLVGQLTQRHFFGQVVRLSVRRISPRMNVVTLPRNLFPKYFSPGAHVRIAPTYLMSRFWFLAASHPYTIASLASDEESVRLIVKPGKRFQLSDDDECIIYGPYPSVTYDGFADSQQTAQPSRRIVVITGGVGISFAAPIVTSLRRTHSKIKLLWAARSNEDIILLKILGLGDVDVFISPEAAAEIEDTFLPEIGEPSDGKTLRAVEDESIELSSNLNTDDLDHVSRSDDFIKHRNIKVIYERMNIEEELKAFRDSVDAGLDSDNSSMCVISCGSRKLVGECSRWGKKLGAKVIEELYEI